MICKFDLQPLEDSEANAFGLFQYLLTQWLTSAASAAELRYAMSVMKATNGGLTPDFSYPSNPLPGLTITSVELKLGNMLVDWKYTPVIQ